MALPVLFTLGLKTRIECLAAYAIWLSKLQSNEFAVRLHAIEQ